MAGKTILIVDDDEGILHYLRKTLEMEDYKIFIAIDAMEAFDVINNNSIDLIIGDLAMPKISGLDMIQLLRIKENTKNIRVIVCSGYLDDNHITALANLGVTQCLEKPIDVDRLIEMIETP